tara:strand:- start:1558 stop:1734 length:177 start_codon:yes stop_codon:yes gene_type:complete
VYYNGKENKTMSKNKNKNKAKPRNPYHEVMRTLFKPKTIPDKTKQNNKKACRGKVRED